MHRVDQRARWNPGFAPHARATIRFAASCVLASCIAVNVTGSARAEGGATTPGSDACSDSRAAKDAEAARVAFRAGQTAFSEGAYARAVDFWNQAYEDDCTAHALLLNLAMAQELLGQPEDAIHTLALFNRRSPASPYVEANAKRIQQLQLAAAEKTRERARRAHEMAAPADHPPPAADASSLSLPLVVSVAGGAVALVGGALFVEGRLSASSAGEGCGETRQACTGLGSVVDGERARARAQVGGWMAGSGLVAAAGGLVWHFLARPQRPLDQPAATSELSLMTELPGAGAGLEWAGRF